MNRQTYQDRLKEILELVFWHGQGNKFPEQNNQPGTSVDEAFTAILELNTSALPEPYDTTRTKIEDGFEHDVGFNTALTTIKQTIGAKK